MLGNHNERTLKARHAEALDIYDAWTARNRVTGGTQSAAVGVHLAEAWDWVQTCTDDLKTYRAATRRPGRK